MSLVLTTALSVGSVKAAQGRITRISGANRYATAAQVAILNWTTTDNIVLVSGEGYADALVASALAGKYIAPLVLVDQDGADATNNAISYIKDNTKRSTDLNIIGGIEVVSTTIEDKINNLWIYY